MPGNTAAYIKPTTDLIVQPQPPLQRNGATSLASAPSDRGYPTDDDSPRMEQWMPQNRLRKAWLTLTGLSRGLHHCRSQAGTKRQVNIRVVPTGTAIDESINLAHEIFNRVFRKVPERIDGN